MEHWPVIDEKSGIKVSSELRDALIEFTINCLVDDPIEVKTYAKDYFQTLDKPGDDTYCNRFQDGIRSTYPKSTIKTEEAVSTSITSYDDLNIYEKSEAQRGMVLNIAQKCLLFKSLNDEQLMKVVDVLFPVEVKSGDVLMEQGENGDNFYIINYGIFEVWLSETSGLEQQRVTIYEHSGYFGELALMHDVPRMATVRAVTNGKLWAINSKAFKKNVLKAALNKRQRYKELLSQNEILQELSSYDRIILADAFEPLDFIAGQMIIAEGDDGDGMYFIESGVVSCSIMYGGDEIKLKELTDGDYFGELALVTMNPRAATVRAVTDCKLAFLDKNTFDKYMGPCIDILIRKEGSYAVERNIAVAKFRRGQ